MKITRLFWLALYYGLARYLPKSHSKFIGLGGGAFRVLCAKHLFARCGKNINIERMAHFGSGKGIEIGDNSGIGINCRVPDDIKLGDYVMMGPNCSFLISSTHGYDRVDIPMMKQGRKQLGPITIGDDVWIGQQCIVIGGKHIGSHSIIGAGSVVSKDIPDCVIAAGNPIRIIRERK